MTNIFDAVLHHHQPLEAAAPGKTGVHSGVDAGHAEHIGVDHAHTEQLDPASVAAHITAFLLAKRATQCQLKAWLGEGKIKWLAFDFDVLLVVLAEECFERGEQIARMNSTVDIDALELMKGVFVAGVEVFVAKNAAWQQ